MKPNNITFFNKASPVISIDLSSKIGSNGVSRVSDRTSNAGSNIFQTEKSNSKKHSISLEENNKEERCLKVEVIKKMLFKFLVEKKMKQRELARVLNITIKELGKLLLREKVGVVLVNKINLPLIKLYCATRWLQK